MKDKELGFLDLVNQPFIRVIELKCVNPWTITSEQINNMIEEHDKTKETCKTEDAVIEMIRSRGKVGRAKYGTSMDRKDLHPDEWVTHLQEELADALQYAERLKEATELLHEAYYLMTKLSERNWECALEWLERYHEQYPHKYKQP